jgi:hypothetical protein
MALKYEAAFILFFFFLPILSRGQLDISIQPVAVLVSSEDESAYPQFPISVIAPGFSRRRLFITRISTLIFFGVG